MEPPSFLSEALGSLLYALADMQPLALVYLHLIISALLPIYAASHASLSCPISAQKPEKRRKKKRGDIDDEDEDEEADFKVHVMEGLRPSDAVMFPILAGLTLSLLYVLIKWTKWLNTILNIYFGILALPATTQLLNDTLLSITQLLFPRKYVRGKWLFLVHQRSHSATGVCHDGQLEVVSYSPLPGYLSKLPLGATITNLLWKVRGFFTTRLTLRIKAGRFLSLKTRFGVQEIFSAVFTLFSILYYNTISKPWWMTNLMGFAFSYSALKLMSPSTFATGTITLVGLFFYDIYMVFYTPMMIEVAKAVDAPIKLMFPRPPPPSAKPGQAFYSMLGLGDIVLPGIIVGLCLRFDLYMHYLRKQRMAPVSPKPSPDQSTLNLSPASALAMADGPPVSDVLFKAKYLAPTDHAERFWLTSWSEVLGATVGRGSPYVETFAKPYFDASLVGYVMGLLATLLSMHLMHHGQPALLYLVPGVLIACWGTAVVRGELSAFWNFTEHEQSADPEKEAKHKASQVDKHPTIGPLLDQAQREQTQDHSQGLETVESGSGEVNKSSHTDIAPASPNPSDAQNDDVSTDDANDSPKSAKYVRFELPEHRPRSPGNFEARKGQHDEISPAEHVLFSISISLPTRTVKPQRKRRVMTCGGNSRKSFESRDEVVMATGFDSEEHSGTKPRGYAQASAAKRMRLA